ncbi:MAG: HlyD family efflux transporter periplasmic adaptor subunit [Methylobacterium mesophilicum]|nr:HlyD family efflux transporter periplasmic adaptor subunit [Methylobacterium mesophilicum]
MDDQDQATQARNAREPEEDRKPGSDAQPSRKPGADQPEAEGSETDQPEADKPTEEKPERPSFLRRHPGWVVLGLLVLAALAVAGYFVWLIFFHPYESTDDAFVDARSFSVATKVSGFVSDVSVEDNQHLAAGDVILRIDPVDYEAALDQAKATLEGAQASVQSADAQIAAAKTTVEQRRSELESTQAALQYASDEAARLQALQKSGTGTVQAAQQATSTLQQAQASAAQAQAAINSALRNVDVAQAQKASAIASRRQAEASQRVAEQNIGYTTITAAQPGRVVRLSGAKGQFVDAGQSVAMFVPDEIWVTANFKETQITDMRPGQAVNVVIDAYPDHELKGKVDSVQPGSGTAFSLLPAENATGNYVKVTQRVPVKIVVDRWPEDVSIGPGMSVVPTVTVRPRD